MIDNKENARMTSPQKDSDSNIHPSGDAMLSSAFICPNCHFGGPSDSMVTALTLCCNASKPEGARRWSPSKCTCSSDENVSHAYGHPHLLEVEETIFSQFPVESLVQKDQNPNLIFIFVMFVIFGSANAIFGKLSAIPMYNYPNFFNIWICILFVVLCYTYIAPAVYLFNAIPREQFKLSKRPFAVMGILDCLGGLMTSFSAVYLPGPLLVLLRQAAIPVSMCFSVLFLKAKYCWWHYLGATTVVTGIVIVLEPLFSSRHLPDYLCIATSEYTDEFCTVCEQQTTMDACLSQHIQAPQVLIFSTEAQTIVFDDGTKPACSWIRSTEANLETSIQVFWSFVLILANIPNVLSGIYKERYSDQHEVDSVYINAWIAIFQTMFSVVLAVPAGYLTSPPVPMSKLPKNFRDGLKCYFGIGSIKTGCHPDQYCELWGPVFSNVFLLVNAAYAIFAILILKHGSANLMFLALTLMVPISNLAFAMPGMPQRSVIHASDIIGLIAIMSGLVCYRFGSSVNEACSNDRKRSSDVDDDGGLTQLLLHEDTEIKGEIIRV